MLQKKTKIEFLICYFKVHENGKYLGKLEEMCVKSIQ